jgi:hypothetical protein
MGEKNVDESELGNFPVTMFSLDDATVSPQTFQELKDKFGLEVRLRTNKAGLDQIMRTASEVDGYDRTIGSDPGSGYQRSYDKS